MSRPLPDRLELAAPGVAAAGARLLLHLPRRASDGEALDHEIVQTTWLRAGRVVRQENVLGTYT